MSALTKKVLVVDDDPVVGKSFNRVLSQKGYVVVTAQNGHEALSKLQDGDYDVVFTDIRMPGMDGLELAEQVKARKSWTPVVIITGFGTTSNEDRARAAGVTAFLHKPLSPEMIEESTREALAPHAAAPAPMVPVDIARTIETVHEEVLGRESSLKKIGLLMAGPFIGLAFILALPFVGLAVLAWLGMKALMQHASAGKALSFVKNVALFLVAPFIGLAYILALPFVGLGTLAYLGVKSLAARRLTKKA